MRQNRSLIGSKTDKKMIQSLKNNLMEKIKDTNTEDTYSRPSTSFISSKKHFYNENEDLQIITFQKQRKGSQILEKAKLITFSNKQQIQKAKKILKKSNQQVNGMFLTGCGIYTSEEQQFLFPQQLQHVDMNDALKYLVTHQKDDLQQLRKMIKKTNKDLDQYTQQIYNTKNKVVDAADMFGKELNIDLKIKINKFQSHQSHSKMDSWKQDTPKRKISTSHKPRTRNIF